MGWHVRTAQSPVPDRQAAQSRAQRAVTCVALEAGRSGDRTSKTPSTSYLKARLTEDKLTFDGQPGHVLPCQEWWGEAS